MPRKAAGLSAAEVKTKGPGRHADGGGLYLMVQANGSRFWTFRYQRDGKSHELGLGTAGGVHPIKLAAARVAAYRLLDTLRNGGDPAADKKAAKEKRKAESAPKPVTVVTFKQAAEYFVTSREQAWKNSVHRAQWGSTLKSYCYPIIGDLAVGEIDTGHVSLILEPIWTAKPETASRVRGRIENVLDFARTKGWRAGENPARWKGHLEHTLAKTKKLRTVKHHAALPYQQIGDFMARLRTKTAISAKCLEFAILTACRSGEARGALWSEIDLAAKVWTIPGTRMKAGVEHRVPLSPAALALLADMKALQGEKKKGGLVFPGGKENQPMSDVSVTSMVKAVGWDVTVHGFRSTFRDWAGEATNFPRETVEGCLAHSIGNAVELAYKRGDALEKRAKVMDAWAAYIAKPSKKIEADNVVQIADHQAA